MIQSSSANHLNPHRFEAIQNEAVSFQVVISGENIDEEDENAAFIVFSNANSNALIIQSTDRDAWFDVMLSNKTKTHPICKTDLQEMTMLDLSTLLKGTYNLVIKTKDNNYRYTLVLR